MKFIITGSLGNTGRPLTTGLLEKGHLVTVISSRSERKKEIESLGADAAIGSLEDLDFLTATVAGADAVYLMFPPNFAVPDSSEYYRRVGENYANAIRHSGVKRAVHLSSYGAHLEKGTGFITGSHIVEQILNGLDNVAVTHLRAGYFYTNLFNFAEMIRTAGFIGSNYGGDDPLILVHPLDIAAAAAEEMLRTSSGKDVRYVVSDERTADDVAMTIGAAIGKPDVQWVRFTDEQALESLLKNGLPPHVAANFVEMGAAIHSGILRGDYELHKPETMGKIKLENFAIEFAAAF
ncbi:MAG: NAD(P)H-binding protein [Chitinophagaceae bacterium]